MKDKDNTNARMLVNILVFYIIDFAESGLKCLPEVTLKSSNLPRSI